MENQNAPEKSVINLPEILTAKTYFWNSAGAANMRRRNEEKRLNEVESFFKANGFETVVTNDTVTAKGFGLEIDFSYSESCKNVYKHFNVYKDGKKSNVKALKKVLNIA